MVTRLILFRCTPEDVATLIRTRTKDSNGMELGYWDDTTRPTLVQVEEAIDLAVTEVYSVVNSVNDPCVGAARALVAVGAAAIIERSYFPEQSRSDRSI